MVCFCTHIKWYFVKSLHCDRRPSRWAQAAYSFGTRLALWATTAAVCVSMPFSPPLISTAEGTRSHLHTRYVIQWHSFPPACMCVRWGVLSVTCCFSCLRSPLSTRHLSNGANEYKLRRYDNHTYTHAHTCILTTRTHTNMNSEEKQQCAFFTAHTRSLTPTHARIHSDIWTLACTCICTHAIVHERTITDTQHARI